MKTNPKSIWSSTKQKRKTLTGMRGPFLQVQGDQEDLHI